MSQHEQVRAFDTLVRDVMALYNAGDYAGALALVDQEAGRFPDRAPRTAFWRLCLLSVSGRAPEALAVLRQGLDAGMWWSEAQFADTDLDPLRDLPEFKSLVARSQAVYMVERTRVQPDHLLLVPDRPAEKLPLLIAVHGRNGGKESHLTNWDAARRRGWLVLLPQSTQALSSVSYCWDDAERGHTDLLDSFDRTVRGHSIDRDRIVLAGFSQGSGMAIHAALSGRIGARGFVGVGTFFAEPEALTPLARAQPPVRGYFITGGKDHALDKARAIQAILKENGIPFEEEFYPELGHEFSPDFEASLERALQFILEERE